ncbi:MAG: type II toxin-antitoxin system Phd/YefM family antitoxin [Candidatus Binatia bacterium]
MKLPQDIRPVTHLKSRAAEILKQVNETQRPVVITRNGEPRAVLQDYESYGHMETALDLLKRLAEAEEDVRSRRVLDQDSVFQRVAKRLPAPTPGNKFK